MRHAMYFNLLSVILGAHVLQYINADDKGFFVWAYCQATCIGLWNQSCLSAALFTQLNPIEFILKSISKEVSCKFVRDVEHLKI
jgi:hypothetical protein